MPEGTFLAWLDFSELGLGDDPARCCASGPAWRCTPGRASAQGGAGHARLNFGTSPDIVREAVTRIAAAL